MARHQARAVRTSTLTRRLYLLTTVCLLITIFPLLISIFNFQRTFVIVNQSMVPALHPGDFLITSAVEGAVAVGTIVVFKSEFGGVVAHRVIDRVSVEGRTYYVTKGDANELADSFLIPEGDLLGVLSLVIPKLGFYFMIPRGVALITILVAIVAYVGLSVQSAPWPGLRGTGPLSFFRKLKGFKISTRQSVVEPKSSNTEAGRLAENEAASVSISGVVEKRAKYIQTTLSHLVTEGDDSGEFVVFENPTTGKFVQLARIVNGLLCEVPYTKLSRSEAVRIKTVLTEIHQIGQNVGELSYYKWFEVDELDEAAAAIEKIFIEVFKLPRAYIITSYSSF